MSDPALAPGSFVEVTQEELQSMRLNTKIWECTNQLRFTWNGSNGFQRQKILQQKWVCHNTGDVEWRDVPFVET